MEIITYLAQLFMWILISRYQHPAFDYEWHLWHRPSQSDQLHGTFPDSRLSPNPIQRRLGRQAPLDSAVLYACLCGGHWAEVGYATAFKECVRKEIGNRTIASVSAFLFWCTPFCAAIQPTTKLPREIADLPMQNTNKWHTFSCESWNKSNCCCLDSVYFNLCIVCLQYPCLVASDIYGP